MQISMEVEMRIKLLPLTMILFLGVLSSAAQDNPPFPAPTPPPPVTRATDAVGWVKEHEAQLAQTTDPSRRFHMLTKLAPAALSAGDTEKARAFAKELMDLGDQIKSQPGFGPGNYGRSLFIGNTVLGLIAFNANDIPKAKEHLLAAGRISVGNPTLKSFGPNMLLAKKLLEKGETETVIEYLDLCASFWTNQNGKLDKWKAAVKQGEIPDFGGNLGYEIETWRYAK
jgi:hypothetical protein